MARSRRLPASALRFEPLEPRVFLSAVSGVKFNDLNGDGVKQGGEPGLAGWTIFIDQDEDGQPGQFEPQAITDANGAYTIDTPSFLGQVKLKEVLQAGWRQIAPQPTLAESATAESVASGLERPVFVASPPNDTQRLFILEQHTGRIKILNLGNNTVNPTPFLDLDGLATEDEQGLLGLAFDPNYAENGVFYVSFTATNFDVVVQRFNVSAGNPDVADPASATTIIRFAHPDDNHNGGWLGFGPDGFLYLSSGDGGGSNDNGPGHTEPNGNAQDITDNLLGKILRLDVSGDAFPADADRNYKIPPTNPFVGAFVGDDEIWAYGLRNAWRPSFDRQTGDLWIADVGQDDFEEINFQPAGSAGGRNYGWRLREGTIATPGEGVGGPKPPGAIDPIYVYSHQPFQDPFGFSITGGYVYRGPIEALQGHYFFADYVTEFIRSFEFNGSSATNQTDWTFTLGQGNVNEIASFGEDAAGNLYIVDLGVFSNNGQVFKVVPTGAAGSYTINVDGLTDITGRDFANQEIPPAAPEVEVKFGNVVITDGDATPDAADGTDFGTVGQGSAGPTRTFTVSNTGTDPLTLGAILLPAGFTLTEPLTTSLNPGQSDAFTIRLDSTNQGVFAGTLSFTSNDADENPFGFDLTGEVGPPANVELSFAGTTKATYTDADGDAVTVSLSGPGSGTVVLPPGGAGDAIRIEVEGATTATTLNIATKGFTSVGLIDIDGPAKGIKAAKVSVTEEIEISGDPNASVTIAVDRLLGDIDSTIGIKSLTATEVSVDTDPIEAPWLGKVTTKGDAKRGIAGDFHAALQLDLTGVAAPPAQTLASAKFAGKLLASQWTIVGDVGTIASKGVEAVNLNASGAIKSVKTTNTLATMWEALTIGAFTADSITATSLILRQAVDPARTGLGKLTVKQIASASRVESAGNLGTLTFGTLQNVNVFAGVAEGTTGLPTAFVSQARIKSVTVKGLPTVPVGFVNSNIAAALLPKVTINTDVQTANNGVLFGVVADVLGKYKRKGAAAALIPPQGAPSDNVEPGDTADFRARVV